MKEDAEKTIEEEAKKIEEDEKKRKKEEVKKCPGKCGLAFQKDGGCSVMTCSIPKCGVTYCWDCLGILSSNGTCFCWLKRKIQFQEIIDKFKNKFLKSYSTNESSLEVEKSTPFNDENLDFGQKEQHKKVTFLNYFYVKQLQLVVYCTRYLINSF